MPGYDSCTGCNLCVLPCPVWQQTRDLTLTLKGRARAMQGGATVEDVRDSLAACVVCGACEPVCPEGIDTVGETLSLRALLRARGAGVFPDGKGPTVPPAVLSFARGKDVLLAGAALARTDRAEKIAERLGGAVIAADDGRDIAFALESGDEIDEFRLDGWIRSFSGAKRAIVADGMLVRPLARLLPQTRVLGLGEALLSLDPIRRALRPTDLLVIETRAYHAAFERLAGFYAGIRDESNARFSLDLHRAAIPTGASSIQFRSGTSAFVTSQMKWLLQGLPKVERIVCESADDADALWDSTGFPVVHLSEIA